jgi:hypothetical protein
LHDFCDCFGTSLCVLLGAQRAQNEENCDDGAGLVCNTHDRSHKPRDGSLCMQMDTVNVVDQKVGAVVFYERVFY